MTWLMSESFGLDRRIDNYAGKRPIGLYGWDLELLLDVIEGALKCNDEYPDTTASGYNVLARLSGRLRDEYVKAFGE